MNADSFIICTFISPVQNGDVLVANIFGVGTFTGYITSDSSSNLYTTRISSASASSSGISTLIQTATMAAATNALTVTVTSGTGHIFSMIISDYRGVAGFGSVGSYQNDASATGTSTVTLSNIGSFSWVVDDFAAFSSQNSGLTTITPNSGQTIRYEFPDNIGQTACSGGAGNYAGKCASSDTLGQSVFSWSWNIGVACPCSASESTLLLLGVQLSGVTVTINCYGSCGSTAVTLVNTNATHAVAFNNSYTLFYQFQSQVDGVLVNVTTSLAKSYTNGQTVGLAVYTSTCSPPFTPFNGNCPGFLQASQLGTNPAKGKFSETNHLVTVSKGEWVAIAVSGAFTGLDLNNTDRGCGIAGDVGICNNPPGMSYTPGFLSSIISSSTPCTSSGPCNTAGISTVGLWAWIATTTIVAPPPGGGNGSVCESVTCGLQAFWLALGGDMAAGVAVFIILFGLIGGGALYMTRQHDAEGRIRGFALPMSVLEILALLLLIMLSVAGVLPAWIPLTIIVFAAGSFVGLFVFNRSRNNREQSA